MRLVVLGLLASIVSVVACDKKQNPDSVPSEPARSGTAQAASAPADTAEPAPPKPSAIETTAEGVTKRGYDADTYAITVAAASCKPSTPCTATLEIAAKSGFHVNKDYGTKFTGKSVPGITFKGKDKPEEFSKTAGDFELPAPEKGVMTVRFEGDGSAPLAAVAGKLKMSVCSDATCQLATVDIDLPVPLQTGARRTRAL